MVTETVLEIRNLSIETEAGSPVVSDVSLEVRRGEVLAVIGASGSGKTTLALSALGRLRPGLVHAGGAVVLDGLSMLDAPRATLNAARGARVAYVAQSAAASFNPRFRLRRQVIEGALLHGTQTRAHAVAKADAAFAALNLPADRDLGSRFPHQVSGGQLQRFMIAMAMQEDPLLLICDEPTSALDVTTQMEVIAQLKAAIAREGTAAMFISHDLAVVAQLATRIAVMRHGRLVEVGETTQILTAPRDPYTRELLDACADFDIAARPAASAPSQALPPSVPDIEASVLVAGYGALSDGRPRVATLSDVSLSIAAGEIVALIGESGSGKSTFARVLAGLLPAAQGSLRFEGRPIAADIADRTQDERRRIQMVYQSADTALNPRLTLGRTLARVLKFHKGLRGAAARERAEELLRLVQLPPHYLSRTPMELSGGEKQRANLARALAADPKVLICDEITSALDTIVSEGIIGLLRELRDRLGLAVLFISHDLATVISLADRVAVLRNGHMVESGPTTAIIGSPTHPYTRLLVASVPQLDPAWLGRASVIRAGLLEALDAQEASAA